MEDAPGLVPTAAITSSLPPSIEAVLVLDPLRRRGGKPLLKAIINSVIITTTKCANLRRRF
jgi:hypothetical protein